MTPDQAAHRQAAAANDYEKLLRELQLAQIIIGNASQLMTISQRLVWGERNANSAARLSSAYKAAGAAVIAEATGSAA
ncbi:hypothetical protein [Cupriavidus campinensis]|uniref:Uncharacterized protein n=1 Tax=Cupriavidus campinensis TaxID=151783 RepID=A0AAE9HVD6_9BURK|nr:hypothetical protein [Cupriavidus campinensis]URF02822.1 hypothetical protein M5D45_09585 [Cupriavidus campinensis]